MYLKKLQLYGFKSFANKTEFIFEPGVTAIVGPNGCGKSNISDSIKWVLGEQSAKSLRGLKMEDIIFNGTVNTEPVNFAEVSLTISNHSKILPIEYEEVTIARRLFRSGESEYLLNKMPVRLKDITELLMGTGIGTDNYFLMEQGKIDLVLSSKPEERRAIFEEASGITKYKSKRKEALNKLEQTEANILRINDIISEVQRQINSIERQAQKARRYQKSFERLKDLELAVSKTEYEGFDNQYAQMQAEIENIKLQQSRTASEVDLVFVRLKDMRSEAQQADEQITQIKNSLSDSDNIIFRNAERIQLDRERIQELSSNSSQLVKVIESSLIKITDFKKQIEQLGIEKDLFSSEKSGKENIIKEKSDQLACLAKSIEEAEAKIVNCKSEAQRKVSHLSSVNNQLSKIGANALSIENQSSRLKGEKEDVSCKLSRLNEELAALGEEENTQFKKVEELKVDLETASAEFKNIQNDINDLNKKYEDTQKEFVTLDSKAELLQEIMAKHEGFSEAVRILLGDINKDKQWHKDILGVLADFVACSENYESCIEAVLSDDLESVVVEDRQTAQQAIDYLKQNELGRIKFVVLPKTLPNNASEGLISFLGFNRQKELLHPDVIGKAIDFVKAEPKYQPLLAMLLENVWIVKDLNCACEVSSKLPAVNPVRESCRLKPAVFSNGVKLVTLDGQVVFRNFISGGKTKMQDGVGLIGREAKLNKIRQQALVLNEKLQLLDTEKENKNQSLAAAAANIGTFNSQMHKDEIQLANKHSDKNKTEEEFTRLNDKISAIDLELDNLSKESGALAQQDTDLRNQADKLEEDLKETNTLIDSNQNWIQANLKEKESVLIEIAKTNAELESLTQRQVDLDNNLNFLIESSAGEEVLCQSKKSQIEDSQVKTTALNQEILELEFGLNDISEKKILLESELNTVLSRKKEISDVIFEKESEYEKLQKELNQLGHKLHSVQTQSAQIEFGRQRLTDRITQAYKVDLGSYKLLVEYSADTRQEIEELKVKLDSIGAVNLDALGEEKELNERFNFMIAQRDDLLKAKSSLLEAISKINKTTKEMFIDTFSKAQVEFKNFFRELFGGGDAELFLLDEQDVLESGIEIAARPPGKRLSNISLLSGGEKAMTALALLFAVFKIKPSPFCLMDEIDAPLDEANIDRFSRVLREFIKDSQFIIVTHNKKTITIADVMYGITMEQSGISKVVSVKFDEKKVSAQKEEALSAV